MTPCPAVLKASEQIDGPPGADPLSCDLQQGHIGPHVVETLEERITWEELPNQ